MAISLVYYNLLGYFFCCLSSDSQLSLWHKPSVTSSSTRILKLFKAHNSNVM